MKRVKKLSPEIITSIAAGEVIQRPVHVVKELIENSLDAQAKTITILLKNSGLEQIEVIDDGRGINPDDLVLALTPHATSKFEKLDDFQSLVTQGFRGEALSSIAVVAEVSLASRIQKEEAGRIIHSNISPLNVKPHGMPKGTRVTVKNLFRELPVRQEYLQKSKSELRRIIEIVTTLALGNPEVGFELKHNDRLLFRYETGQSLIQRTEAIFGSKIFSQLLPVNFKSTDVKVTGFVSQPSLWTKQPTKQYIFVNRRPIKHTRLQKRLHQLINQVQANQLYPMYSLNIQILPQLVDVNIHPQKTTIDVYNFSKLATNLEEMVQPLLSQRPLTYSSAGEMYFQASDTHGIYKTHRFRRGLMNEYHKSSTQKPKITGEIQQMANLYLIAPTTDGLLLVDQHALHERLLFDEFKSMYKDKQSSLLKNKTAINLVFDFTPQEALALEDNLEDLAKMGLSIENFGKNSYKINSVPEILADHDILELIREVLDQSVNDQGLQVDSQTESLLASLACRTAVKAGDYLEPDFRQELINKLLNEKHPGTCPHGRPVAIRITLSELHKLFKRT